MKKKAHKNRAKARKMKLAGHSYAEIGKALGVSRQRAQQYVRIPLHAPKGGTCDKCGSTVKVLHYHHTDYAKDQFEVLCARCHGKIHHPFSVPLNKGGKVGRPKLPQNKVYSPGISLRLPQSDRKAIDAAIAASGLTQSIWARKALLYVAKNGIVLA